MNSPSTTSDPQQSQLLQENSYIPPTKPNSDIQTPPLTSSPFYKKRSFVIVFITLSLLLLGSLTYYSLIQDNQTSTDSPPSPTPILNPQSPTPTIIPQTNTTISPELTQSHNQFGLQLFQYLYQNTQEPNIMISPTSIALAFNLAINGAVGETYDQIQQMFFPEEYSNDQINQTTQQLIQFLENPDENVELAIANSIWTNDQFEFLPEFLNTNQQFLNAEARAMDFTNPETVTIINDWVNTNTREKIPTILEPPIPNYAMAYLINAIYFKGTWTTQFNPEETRDEDFTNLDGTTAQVPMMRLKQDDFKYTQTEDGLQIIQLPYGTNQRLAMNIYLPTIKNESSYALLLSKLTPEQLQTWEQSLTPQEGTVLLPRFKSEYKNNQLAEQLQNLGLTAPFQSADFSRMIDAPVEISKVIHKTFIEVNEEGTEAAAATSIEMVLTSIQETPLHFYMEVNHPFLYTIQDTQSGAILFLGTITQL